MFKLLKLYRRQLIDSLTLVCKTPIQKEIGVPPHQGP